MNNKTNIKVSVIVPVYNVEKYLKRCVDSLINQTLKEIEIILVDDGSKDNSSQMCDEFAKLDNRIKVIHKENNGLGMARNSGLDIATGEYVVFIDSDDFIELNAYEEMYNRAKEKEVDMVISDFYYYDTESSSKSRRNLIKKDEFFNRDNIKNALFQMIGNNPLKPNDNQFGCSVCKNMYKREKIINNNIKFYSEREFVSEDAIFNMMLIPKLENIIVINKAYYYYCYNKNSISLTTTFKIEKIDLMEKLLYKEYELLKENSLFEEGRIYVDSTYLGGIRYYVKNIAHNCMNFKKKLYIINNIVNKKIIREILQYFPYKMMPFKQKLFTLMLKQKNKYMILLLGRLQKLTKN